MEKEKNIAPQHPRVIPEGKPAPSLVRPMPVTVTPRTIITILLALAGVWVVIRLWPVLLVLVAAAMLVGALGPLVSWLEEKKIGRRTAIAIVFSAGTVLAALVLLFSAPPLLEQVRSLA